MEVEWPTDLQSSILGTLKKNGVIEHYEALENWNIEWRGGRRARDEYSAQAMNPSSLKRSKTA